MKKLLVATTVLLAGAALAQTAPVTEPAAPPAPMAHPMHDRVMNRAEMVAMVREHFGKLDANKDGSVTKDEAMAHAPRLGMKRGEGRHEMMGGGPAGDPAAAFDRLDSDKNGSISREEFTKAHEQRIERRIVMREGMKEGAKDGKGMRKHMMSMRHGGFGSRMIVMADSDKDGKITLAEAEAMAMRHFDEMDTNKDGQVTPEERRAGHPKMMRKIEEKKTAS